MINFLKRILRNFIWKLLKIRWKLNSGIEFVIENDNDWFVFNEIFTDGEYDDVIKFIKIGETRQLILDLGANVGYFSLRIADYFLQNGLENYKIYQVEGSRKNFLNLKRRVSQKLLKDRCYPVHGLVGYRSGTSVLVTQTDHFGFHISKNFEKGERIEFVDIEELLKNDNGRISLLKCDIEGSEELFLSNYTYLLERTDLAVFEFHAGDCDVGLCRTYLANAGLKYLKTLKRNKQFKTSVEIFNR